MEHIAMLAGLMAPYYKYTFDYKKRKDSRCPFPYFIIGESLQLPNKQKKDCEDVNTILNGVNLILPQVHRDEAQWSRKKIGLILRKLGANWRVSHLLAFISEVEPFKTPLAHPVHHTTTASPASKHPRDPEVDLPDSATPLLAKYDAFANWVKKVGLEGVWDLKTIVNGGDVQQLFSTKSGPWMAATMQKILEWQLENPDASKTECEHWVKENKSTLVYTEPNKR